MKLYKRHQVEAGNTTRKRKYKYKVNALS